MVFYFDRYKEYRGNGEIKILPGITLDKDSRDKQIVYRKGQTRLDILSQKYYNNPYHGFLIMARNLQWGGLEFDIPDGAVISIPFPLNSAIERYNEKVLNHIELYGE